MDGDNELGWAGGYLAFALFGFIYLRITHGWERCGRCILGFWVAGGLIRGLLCSIRSRHIR